MAARSPCWQIWKSIVSARSLREAVDPDTRGNIARFAAAAGVSWTTAWRWTLPANHPDRVVPPYRKWLSIERATGGRWQAPGVFDGAARSTGRSK